MQAVSDVEASAVAGQADDQRTFLAVALAVCEYDRVAEMPHGETEVTRGF